MVAVGTEWTLINYWSSSVGVQDFVAQVSVWGKVRSQSITSNTSIVDFKYRKRIYSPSGASYKDPPALWNYNNYSHRIRFTNGAHSASATFAFGRVDYPANRDWTDISISDTSDLYWSNIAHNDDGTCSIAYTATGTRPNGSATYDESGTITLPTITRASKPTASKSTVTLDGSDSVTINTNRMASGFTHTLKITCGGNTVTVNDVGASYTWTPGVAYWMPYMTSWEQTVTVSCTTYSGSTQIGSAQSCTFKLRVDTSVYKPVIGATTTADPNPTTQALETAGTFILNASKLTLTAEFTENNTDYGSELASATVTCGGQTATYALSGTSGTITHTFPDVITTNRVVVTVVDKRGVSATKNITLTSVPYQPIAIKSVKGVRTNASGDEAETGDRITYTIVLDVYWGSFGQANNGIVLKSKYKSSSMADYSAWQTLNTIATAGTDNYVTYTLTGTTDDTVLYSSADQYDVIFEVSDELSSADTLNVRILPGVPVFGWGEDYFDVYGTLHVHDRDDVMKYISIDANSVATVPVSFSGAVGGTVNWTVFKFGKLRIATCKWRATASAVINGSWAGIYYSDDFDSPNYPVAFNDVLHTNVSYLAGDQASHAEVWDGGHTSVSTTSFGQFYLVRPNDGGAVTVNHPVFSILVIGTVS